MKSKIFSKNNFEKGSEFPLPLGEKPVDARGEATSIYIHILLALPRKYRKNKLSYNLFCS